MDINNIFAKRLRELRKNKGFTQEKLAEMSDIDYKYPSSPSLSVLEKLSHGLGITLTEFVTFIEEGRKQL